MEKDKDMRDAYVFFEFTGSRGYFNDPNMASRIEKGKREVRAYRKAGGLYHEYSEGIPISEIKKRRAETKSKNGKRTSKK